MFDFYTMTFTVHVAKSGHFMFSGDLAKLAITLQTLTDFTEI